MSYEKQLGKITSAKYGLYEDRPFLFGLQLQFSLNGGSGGIGDGGMYLINISKHDKHCEWTEESRNNLLIDAQFQLVELLKSAKVNTVNQLIGKPVEIEITNNTFKSFRILTEVL